MVEFIKTISVAAMSNLMEDPKMQAVYEDIQQKLDNEEDQERRKRRGGRGRRVSGRA